MLPHTHEHSQIRGDQEMRATRAVDDEHATQGTR